MPRSGAEARARLREAALDLYRDQGYDATTTAEIAARAGVTERTYFRHFADKREVLFDGETELRDVMTAAVASAPPPDLKPLQLALQAYEAAIPLFVAGRPIAERRAKIIMTSPALQERAHAKSAALTEALIAAVEQRGISKPTARLAARAAAAIFENAIHTWPGTSAADLASRLEQASNELRELI